MRWFALFLALLAPAAYAAEAPLELPASEVEEFVIEDVSKLPAPPAAPTTTQDGKTTEMPDHAAEHNAVALQVLNKVTGNISKFTAIKGRPERAGRIEIIAHRCWQASPEDRPENAALLEVRELKAGEAPATIFEGWMFSSSPGLSALEHPFYDITVLACESYTEQPDGTFTPKEDPKTEAKTDAKVATPEAKKPAPTAAPGTPEKNPNHILKLPTSGR